MTGTTLVIPYFNGSAPADGERFRRTKLSRFEPLNLAVGAPTFVSARANLPNHADKMSALRRVGHGEGA